MVGLASLSRTRRHGIDWLTGIITCLAGLYAVQGLAEEAPPRVGISETIPYVIVDHRGTPVRVERIQDTENRLVDDFSKTSRPCPPFCIHAMEAAPGVRTVGELELLAFVKDVVENEQGLLVDARMSNWYESETIPGAVNIPFVIFTTDSDKREKILSLLGVTRDETGLADFSNAMDLLLFCNGPWCDQSPRAIKALLEAGYPADRLNYYRGGMHAWKSFGLTTVLPTRNTVE